MIAETVASSFASLAAAGRERAFAISDELPHEAGKREALLDRAMGPGRKRKSSQKLRRGRLPALALCARDASGSVYGTVRLWNVAIGETDALLLGPLAVDPSLEGRGMGSALMREAVERAARGGYRAIILVGDPEYYGRFGFSAELTGAIAMPGPYETRRLLALELVPGALEGAAGIIRATGRRKPGGRIAANAA